MEESPTAERNFYNQETKLASELFSTSLSGKGTFNELSATLGKVTYRFSNIAYARKRLLCFELRRVLKNKTACRDFVLASCSILQVI
jgi:hypothetical protein